MSWSGRHSVLVERPGPVIEDLAYWDARLTESAFSHASMGSSRIGMMQRLCPAAATSAGGSPVMAANDIRSGSPGALDRGLVQSRLAAEHVGGLGQQVVLPVGDLIGCTSCYCAGSAGVLSPRTAASAT